MNTVLDLIYRLLAHPTDAMSDVTTGEKMKESSIIWGFVILLLALSSVEAGSFVTAFLASFVGTGSLLLLHSAVVDYISGLLGGRGTARGITAGFMCASIPYAFSVFFSLIFQTAQTFYQEIGSIPISHIAQYTAHNISSCKTPINESFISKFSHVILSHYTTTRQYSVFR